MNDHDRMNLNFILTLETKEEWDTWADGLDEDDLLYALELVRTAMSEAIAQKMTIEEEIQDEEGLDCSDALEFINRVKKGVSK